MLVELELRRDAEVDHGVLEAVLVFGLTILQDGHRVGQLPVVILHMGQRLAEVVLVGDVEEGVADRAARISVGREHGALHISQERGRGGCAVGVVGRRTVVAEVARLVGKACVEAHTELARELDVGVEADVQTAGAIVLQRALVVGIAQRQVVVGHVVTALHVDAVVLRDGRAVDLVLPVGVVVILGIIIIGGILVEELEVGDGCARCAEEVGGIALELACIHHVDELGLKRDTCRQAGRDAGSHGMVAACLDEDDAVGTLGTIESRPVLQHGNLLDVGRRDVGQDVVVETVVEQSAAILLVEDDPVDDDERLGIDVERVETAEEHHVAHASRTVALHGTHIGAQTLLDLVLNGHAIGEAEILRGLCAEHVGT